MSTKTRHARPGSAVSSGRSTQTLSFTELRAYRHRLTAEEDKVSYWRRLSLARIDALEAGAHHESTLSLRDLLRALGDTGTGHARLLLGTLSASGPLPDLPDLAEMWAVEMDPRDPDQVADALERLHVAVAQLTLYGQALQGRIEEANAELLRRYRENPLLALSILPS